MAQDRIKGANDKVVLALIGAGGRGTGVILGMLKNNKNVEARYVCDVNDLRGAEAMDVTDQAPGLRPEAHP